MTSWLHPPESDPDAAVRLFLFHHSGGSAAMYNGWPDMLPGDIDCRRVQLPGRQERHRDPPYTELDPLVSVVSTVVGAELDGRPYAFFGHSMGALLAYRLALTMARTAGAGPVLVGVSGWAPAGFSHPTVDDTARSDTDLEEAMRRLGNWPSTVDNGAELRRFVLPAFRADLRVCASFADDGAVAACPIVSYSGRDDPLLAPEAMRSWANRSADYLGNRQYPGGHFFITEHSVAIAADLAQLLYRYGAPP